jgi:hypothetical protein
VTLATYFLNMTLSILVHYVWTKNRKEVIVKLKEWQRAQVDNYKDVGKTIEEWQKNGWRARWRKSMIH